MSDIMAPEVERIRERMNRATPGPWAWGGNTAAQHIYLATQRWGRHMVMQFDRWGMQNAQPTFFHRPEPEHVRKSIASGSTHKKASEVPIYEVAPHALSAKAPEVYREDIIGLRNADAQFIAHSRADVEYLVGEVDRLNGLLREGHAANTPDANALRLIGWYCEHVWGTPSAGTHMSWSHKKSKMVRETNVHTSWRSSLWAKADDPHRCPSAVPAFVVVAEVSA